MYSGSQSHRFLPVVVVTASCVVKEAVYLTAAAKHREVAGRSRAKRLASEDMPPVTTSSPAPAFHTPTSLKSLSVKFLVYDTTQDWIYTAPARQVDAHS